MERREQNERRGSDTVNRIAISRRAVFGLSGAVVLGLWIGSVCGGDPGQSSNPQEHDAAVQARLDQRKAFAERMRSAGSREERIRMMEEVRALDRQRIINEFQSKLGLADTEWAIVKPRIEAVYNLTHSPAGTRTGAGRRRTEVEQRSAELQELLDSNEPEAGQIKAKLTALRLAKEKAQQDLAEAHKNLCQLMTLRQEAVLVLNGLLE